MKKQLFSLVMALALIVLAGTSAWAQNGLGYAPNKAYFGIEGATTTHTITLQGGPGNTTSWAYLVVDNTAASVGEAGVAAVLNTDYKVISGGAAGSASVTVQWLKASAAKVYAVEVTETASTANGLCTTKRRSYVSIFGFDVNVFLTTNTSGAGQQADNPMTKCANWSGTVIDTLSAAMVGAMNTAYKNNPVSNLTKIDSTYWRVNITLSGATGSFTLQNMKWRFYYTLLNSANNVFEGLKSFDGATFLTEGGATTQMATATTALNLSAATSRIVYVPAAASAITTADYDFMIIHHVILGSAPSTYQVRIDSANIEYQLTAGGAYDNGTKYQSALRTTGGFPHFADAQTGTQTVTFGPATPNVLITD